MTEEKKDIYWDGKIYVNVTGAPVGIEEYGYASWFTYNTDKFTSYPVISNHSFVSICDVTGLYELQFRVLYGLPGGDKNRVRYTRPYPSEGADQLKKEVDDMKEKGTYSYDIVAIPLPKPFSPKIVENIGFSQEVAPVKIQIDPSLMRDKKDDRALISYSRLLGEFTGTLKGLRFYDFPAHIKDNILNKIAELEAITTDQILERESRLQVLVDKYEEDLADAAGKLGIDIPEPGTTIAKLLSANVLLRHNDQDLWGKIVDLKTQLQVPEDWKEKFTSWATDVAIGSFKTRHIIKYIERYILKQTS